MKTEFLIIGGGAALAWLFHAVNKKPGSITTKQLDSVTTANLTATAMPKTSGIRILPLESAVLLDAPTEQIVTAAQSLKARIEALSPGLSITLNAAESAAASIAGNRYVNPGSTLTKNTDGSTTIEMNVERILGRAKT